MGKLPSLLDKGNFLNHTCIGCLDCHAWQNQEIRIVKEIRSRKKVPPVVEAVSDKPNQATKADFDPG